MDEVKKQFEKPLTLREKLAINILVALLKIVKPTDYTSEYSKEMDKIKELIELV